ncbi:LysR family transcriptional regulator [Amycolatopsis sp. CA-230715]|uniref:LysR family transcriptional regulator n=1 Tax=Amycolatopsis sp. CA-230715 TaxID=2745196 RepID=UPI001C0199BB|nr:LysR family transcriptional regulator [Amycolatopsis sp. CA-230715]QWF83618.1 hypothetical protein HUW46_07061 [Amycolatopsis sp. CA-230715]
MAEFTVLGLRVVRAAAAHGSFSVAAERLGYTQSAVSRQIALMEQVAGCPLFERGARGVRPTEAGLLVVRHAEAVLTELHTARKGLAELGSARAPRLRVGAFSTAMAALVPDAIAAFVDRQPRAKVSLREGLSPALLNAVARGRIDFAVVTSPGEPPPGVELTALLDDPLFLAVPRSHPLASSPGVGASELRTQRWIAGSADPGSTLLGAWAGSSWQPEIAFVARDWVAKFGLVSAGLGVTMVPGLVVPSLPPSVVAVPVDEAAAVRATAVAYRTTTDAHRAFVTALEDTAAGLAAEARRRVRAR